MISLFNGLFLTFPLPLFSGAHALVRSFVTLYLLYMMKLYTGSEIYFRSLQFWLIWEGFCYGARSPLSSICRSFQPAAGICCTKGMLCSCCLNRLQKPNRTIVRVKIMLLICIADLPFGKRVTSQLC